MIHRALDYQSEIPRPMFYLFLNSIFIANHVLILSQLQCIKYTLQTIHEEKQRGPSRTWLRSEITRAGHVPRARYRIATMCSVAM